MESSPVSPGPDSDHVNTPELIRMLMKPLINSLRLTMA